MEKTSDSTILIILFFTGCALLILSIFLRSKSGAKYEIKMIDLLLGVIPLLFWLAGTGKIQKLAVGGVEFETAQAFLGASRKSIESQILRSTPLNIKDIVRNVERARKGDVAQIPRLIKEKTEALEFRLKHGKYWGPAIKTYFESLDAHSFLRYAIIYYQDGTLYGIYDAKKLLQYFREQGESSYHNFAKLLNYPNQLSLKKLKELPGFIPGEYAVPIISNKRTVLEEMEKLELPILPVVDSEKRFIGTVERAQLTASLIVDVAKKLENLK